MVKAVFANTGYTHNSRLKCKNAGSRSTVREDFFSFFATYTVFHDKSDGRVKLQSNGG